MKTFNRNDSISQSLLRETFYSWTCIAIEYMVFIQVLLENVSLGVLLVKITRNLKEMWKTVNIATGRSQKNTEIISIKVDHDMSSEDIDR